MTQHQTTEQVTEILARELYVRQVTIASTMSDNEARNNWYLETTLETTPEVQERFRRQASLLEASLAESNLALTWVVQ